MATHPCETWSTLRRTRRMHIPQHPIPGPALRCCEWGANRQRIGSSASCQSKRSLVHRLQHTNSLSYSMALYHGCCLQNVLPVPSIQDIFERNTYPSKIFKVFKAINPIRVDSSWTISKLTPFILWSAKVLCLANQLKMLIRLWRSFIAWKTWQTANLPIGWKQPKCCTSCIHTHSAFDYHVLWIQMFD